MGCGWVGWRDMTTAKSAKWRGAWNGHEIFDLSLLHSDLLPVPPVGNQQPASMGGSQGTEPGLEGQDWMEICCVKFLNPALHDLKGYIDSSCHLSYL